MVCRKPRVKCTWNMKENFFMEKPMTSYYVENGKDVFHVSYIGPTGKQTRFL